MGKFDNRSFADRAANSAKAKEELLAKFAARPKPDDPVMVERQKERQAIAEARDARQAERDRQRKLDEAARLEQMRIDEEARIEAELLAEERRKQDEIDTEIQRKADRDARYAARKERKKKR